MAKIGIHRVQEFYTEANAALSSRSASACLAAILKAKQTYVCIVFVGYFLVPYGLLQHVFRSTYI